MVAVLHVMPATVVPTNVVMPFCYTPKRTTGVSGTGQQVKFHSIIFNLIYKPDGNFKKCLWL